jgi:hypothetical protein
MQQTQAASAVRHAEIACNDLGMPVQGREHNRQQGTVKNGGHEVIQAKTQAEHRHRGAHKSSNVGSKGAGAYSPAASWRFL